ncbi:hypothetical protein [Cellulomonas chengniuliangii]|nr:hypothetical protein [Cellulomonas chengniuliangii]
MRTGPSRLAGRPTRRRCSVMADLAFLALTVAFFAAVALVARTLDHP